MASCVAQILSTSVAAVNPRLRILESALSPRLSLDEKARLSITVLGSSRSGSGEARLAQSVERKALNLVVVGSSPTVGVTFSFGLCSFILPPILFHFILPLLLHSTGIIALLFASAPHPTGFIAL
ncbi:hypothetical protein CRG98_033817 [Punica granatum]|uniref:Uncharacterized protein n=1 Tax=Punica granatum TaxID=22663 RepID=A0A2I0IQ83_PUNGR|nr:hypothetical protein CRG98_033817 [Punica granatum]